MLFMNIDHIKIHKTQMAPDESVFQCPASPRVGLCVHLVKKAEFSSFLFAFFFFLNQSVSSLREQVLFVSCFDNKKIIF